VIPSSIRRRFGGMTSAVAVRVSGRALAFLLALVLARELGVEGFGIYSFATTWVTVLLVVSGLGYGGLLLRQTAVYVERDQPELLLGLIHTARRTIIPLSIVLVVLAAAAAALFFDPIFLVPLLIALPTVIVRTFSLVWEGVLRGLGRVDESFISTFVVYPLVMLSGVGLLAVLSVDLTPEIALVLFLLSFMAGAVAVWLLARRRLRPIIGATPAAKHPEEGRYSLLLPFTTLTLLGSVSASLGLITLGLFDLPDEVGIFQVARKLTEPISLIFSVIGMSLAALLASLYARDGIRGARPRIARAVRLSLLGALPIAAILLLAPDFVLGLFGQGFEGARASLFILTAASLLDIASGVALVALMMTHHQRAAIVAKGIGLTINLVLCLTLIPALGASGAAIALAGDTIATNALAVVLAWKFLGLNTTAFSLPRRMFGRV